MPASTTKPATTSSATTATTTCRAGRATTTSTAASATTASTAATAKTRSTARTGNDTLRGQGDGDPLLLGGEGNDNLQPNECGPAHPGVVHVVDGGPGSNSVDLSGLLCYPFPYGGVTVTLDGVANDLEAGGGAPGTPTTR